MAETREEYEVDINGLPHTVLLDEADAERLGAKKVQAQNKAQTPKNKSA